jgi:serine O-acetyltransferase
MQLLNLFFINYLYEEYFLKHLHEGYTQRKYDLNKSRIEKFIDDFFRFVFFLELQRCSSENEMNNRLIGFKKDFTEILQSVFDTPEEALNAAEYFFEKFPEVYITLEKDAEFLLQNDPAATSLEEITFSYPGFMLRQFTVSLTNYT